MDFFNLRFEGNISGSPFSRITKSSRHLGAGTLLHSRWEECCGVSTLKKMLEGYAKIKSHPADRDWMKSISNSPKRVIIIEEAGHLVGYSLCSKI